MATINGSTNKSYYIIWLDATESSYSVENNTSTVVVKLYMKRTSGSYAYNGGNYSGTITVNGTSQSYSGTLTYPTSFSEGQSRLYATLTFSNIPHNSDGSKTVSISALYSADFSPSSGSASGSLTLTTIPRRSTMTATRAYIEEPSQLTITKASTLVTYTHSIAYSFGNLSGYILADGSTTSSETKLDTSITSIGFTIPSSWYAEIPNASEGICTLSLKTYNGNTQIGSTYTTSFVAVVNPTTSKPVVTSSVVDTNQDTINLTGSTSANPILVKGYSIPSVTWSASPRHDATITNVSINGTTVTTTPYAFTLNDSYINVVAIDSRESGNGNFTTTDSLIFTLINYSRPTYVLEAKRVAPTSSYAYISFNGTWFNDTFGASSNSLSIMWNYRQSGTSNWIIGGTLTSGTDYTISGNSFYSGTGSIASQIQIGSSLSYEYGWEIQLVASDALNDEERTVAIAQGIPHFDMQEDFVRFNTDVISEMYAPHDFTQTDVDKAYDYLYHGGTLTEEEMILYDLNNDGQITLTDVNRIYMYVQYGVTTSNPARMTINNDGKFPRDLKMIFEDGNGDVKASVGMQGIYDGNLKLGDIGIYSTTNTIVVGNWNGSPIYRTVYNLTTSAGNNDIQSYLISSNIDMITKLDGIVIQPTTNNIASINYYNSSTDWCNVHYRPNDDVIRIRCGSSYGFGDTYLIVEYTQV